MNYRLLGCGAVSKHEVSLRKKLHLLHVEWRSHTIAAIGVDDTLKTKAGDSYKRRHRYTTLRGFIFHKALILIFTSRETFR